MRYPYLIIAAGLTLSGCEAVLNPSPLPRGYTYHRDLYKAPPGPEAPDIGYDYTQARNAEVLEDLRYVARDLVGRLRQETGITGGTLYIRSGEAGAEMDAFRTAFDHVLRETLTEEGYALARFPDEGKTLYFAAGEVPEQDSAVSGETVKSGSYKDLVISLSLWDSAAEAGRVSGVYAVPAYGYSRPDVLEEMLPVIEEEPAE